jgi:transcription elongation factor
VTLFELLTEAGEELVDVSVTSDAHGLIWDRTGRPFATSSADGATAEFRLDPAVAAAAVRTPDTKSSRRGPDWITFSPESLDEHSLDRAEAWFGSAWRRAERP